MHLTPEQMADEQALRDKDTGAELEVVSKVKIDQEVPTQNT